MQKLLVICRIFITFFDPKHFLLSSISAIGVQLFGWSRSVVRLEPNGC